MREVTIIDEDSIPHAPSSKFLTREEMKKLDPDWIWSRKSFIFKYGKPLIVDHNIALALTQKYETVNFEHKEQELMDMQYQQLKKLAVEKGIKWNDTFVSKEKLAQMISEA